MRDNNIIESEYVGWAVRSITMPSFNIIADVTGWENISESTVFKKITVKIVNKKKCGFYINSPVTCVDNFEDNRTLSEVSKIIYPQQFN